MNKYTIVVTQKDIDKGEPGEPTLCPIALACRRQFPGKRPEVSSVRIRIGSRDFKHPRLKQFVRDFDAGNEMKPTRFTIYTKAKLK